MGVDNNVVDGFMMNFYNNNYHFLPETKPYSEGDDLALSKVRMFHMPQTVIIVHMNLLLWVIKSTQ